MTIKNCPYCGGQPEIKAVGDNKQYFTCVCSNCGNTPLHIDEAQMTKTGAIKIWNRMLTMAEKETKSCSDCIHFDVCYKIEHFGRDLETNIPCKEFIGVTDRVEVVRCKDCKYKFVEYDGIFTCNIFSNCYGLPYRINLDDYCSRGERRE